MGALMPANNQERQPCTILLPLFNGATFLPRAVANLCEIAGPGDEILIIDDGSVDISDQEFEKLRKSDPRIVLYKCEHRGLVATLNYGIQVASHELIARADVDDLYAKNRIQVQVEFLSSNPEISAVFSDYEMVSSSGANLGVFPSAISPELTAFSLFSSQRTPHPSVMYRKSAILSVGGYLQEDFPAEDLALWIRLVRKGKIASIPHSLLKYTVHSSSITRTKQDLMRRKSLALRKEYGSSGDFNEILDSAPNLLAGYAGLSHRNMRVIFFLEDLVNFNYLTSNIHRKNIFKLIAKQVMKRNVFLVIPTIHLLFMKVKRVSLLNR
jgi:glycosyltransferase involved in cell wall biosynthesis